MNKIQILNFNRHPVRTISIDGNNWWLLSDICQILGFRNTTIIARELLTSDEWQHIFVKGRRKMIEINDSGLFKVIDFSDRLEADDFKRWVKYGAFPVVPKVDKSQDKSAVVPKNEKVDDKKAKPSVETGLQKAALLVRIAEHKAVPQNEQILLSMAVHELTGIGFKLNSSSVVPSAKKPFDKCENRQRFILLLSRRIRCP